MHVDDKRRCLKSKTLGTLFNNILSQKPSVDIDSKLKGFFKALLSNDTKSQHHSQLVTLIRAAIKYSELIDATSSSISIQELVNNLETSVRLFDIDLSSGDKDDNPAFTIHQLNQVIQKRIQSQPPKPASSDIGGQFLARDKSHELSVLAWKRFDTASSTTTTSLTSLEIIENKDEIDALLDLGIYI